MVLADPGGSAIVDAVTDPSPPEAPPALAVVHVEVLPDPAYAGRLAPKDLVERFQDRVEELGVAIGGIADRLHEALERQLTADGPSGWALQEVTLELGAILEAETGVLICKTKAAGSFQVSMKWSRSP